MKKSDFLKIVLFSAPCLGLQASELDIPNTFNSGAQAVAAEVNQNFSVIETAVNDNNAKILSMQTEINTLKSTNQTLQTSVTQLQTTITQLQNAQSAVAMAISPRNIDLVGSYSIVGGKAVLVVEFNIPVDTSSFVPFDNVYVTGDSVGSGTIQWSEGNFKMTFTTDTMTTFTSPSTATFSLTIKGTGNNPVKDLQGKAIDGDRNGLPGGDLVISYQILI